MRSLLLSCTLLLALLHPEGLLAQQAPQYISILPRLGVLTQPVPFKQYWNDPPPEFRQVWRYRFAPALAFGMAAEFGAESLPLRLRTEVNHTPSARLHHIAESFGPPLHEEATAGLTSATVAVVAEPEQACFRMFCPRLLAGGGVKHYRFEADVISDDTIYPFAQDQTRLTVQLGAGVAVRLPRITLVAEVNDFSNQLRFFRLDDPSGRVHDTLATMGVTIRLR